MALLFAAFLVIPAFTSCKKTTDTTTTSAISSTRLRIANLSPDLLPVNLYINNQPVNNFLTPYRYPTPSQYFYLLNIGVPLQIRSAGGTQSTVAEDDVNLTTSNAKFTFLVTGLRADSTIRTIFLVDTTSTPAIGQGKVRFVNASPRSVSLDIYANGTKLVPNGVNYLSASNFVALPAGNYDIRVYLKGDQTNILKEINPFTVQDSRIYSIYAHGLVGRTDTSAFALDTLIHR
ncbi:DUF4397 domain-containing protein [Mucilaginibacter ginkgonis]|uniref:DUF4397 domain-containing protein n=1 Tax=Mucilaginibacter ginkgonis TaxID=2682091 RepID=A0A7T7JGZ6_9SPHI|nr:DUF4397 domain-containing protein [Mucilaginibacter ginkgonis]QQL50022.1 DUF4397 domain-containing protein [Mucilaginibacter ginkgonis]